MSTNDCEIAIENCDSFSFTFEYIKNINGDFKNFDFSSKASIYLYKTSIPSPKLFNSLKIVGIKISKTPIINITIPIIIIKVAIFSFKNFLLIKYFFIGFKI